MTGATATEFLPGQPATGKSAGDVSSDGTKVVFQDWADQVRLYEANLDGTGFHQLPVDCTCALLYPGLRPDRHQGRLRPARGQRELAGDPRPRDRRRRPSSTRPSGRAPTPCRSSRRGRRTARDRLQPHHWPAGADPVVGTVHYGDIAPTSGVLSLLDVATGTVTDVLPESSDVVPGDANWSPDSNTIVFSAGPGVDDRAA